MKWSQMRVGQRPLDAELPAAPRVSLLNPRPQKERLAVKVHDLA